MLRDIIIKARSVRSFDTSRTIDNKTLRSFIDTARLTASSCNLQPLKYCISSNKESNDFIFSGTRWAGLLKDYSGPDESFRPSAYIVICLDTDISANEKMFLRDVGIAAQTIDLLAAELGIGCCMLGSFDTDGIASHFQLPSNIRPELLLALGYPAEFPVLEDECGSVAYYRDENNVHHVPKRKTKDIIIKL